jgi:mRNA-degrading endonuclease RelE of RelBE toxin-antitoxin system
MLLFIHFTPSATEDLVFYPVSHQRAIVDAIKIHLTHDADQESRRRKRLVRNPIAVWELRAGDFRVFYAIEGEFDLKIIAIGHKIHNDLFIRGMRVEL